MSTCTHEYLIKAMKHHIKFISIIVLLLSGLNGMGQAKERNWMLNGHLEYMETVWNQPGSAPWLTMGKVDNRLDFRWYPGDMFSFHIGGRNIFNYGQMVYEAYPSFADFSSMDVGFLSLTKLWVSDSSYFFYTNIDRANVQFSKGNFETKLGRQRINWGINLIWTPNDIFNSFNYFDFDYVERPGSDAIFMEYYTGMTSSVQFAFKVDSAEKITSALMYRFNLWNYDFQTFAGVMTDDYVAGLGWSGDIKGAGFTGEASYFIDRDKFSDTNGVLVASASINYTFRNSIFIQGSYLFNSAGTTGKAGWGSSLFLIIDVSPKVFTLAKHSIFGQVSYPVTPLIKGDLSSIWNPNDKSGYVGPSIDISLTGNIGLLLTGQVFWGEGGSEFGDYGSLYYLRIKWSF